MPQCYQGKQQFISAVLYLEKGDEKNLISVQNRFFSPNSELTYKPSFLFYLCISNFQFSHQYFSRGLSESVIVGYCNSSKRSLFTVTSFIEAQERRCQVMCYSVMSGLVSLQVSVYLQNWSHVLSYVSKAESTPEIAEVVSFSPSCLWQDIPMI